MQEGQLPNCNLRLDFRLFLYLCTGGSEVKNPPAMQEMQVQIPGLGRSSGEVNGYPLQYSCLENSMDRGAWWATVHGVAKPEQLSTHGVGLKERFRRLGMKKG